MKEMDNFTQAFLASRPRLVGIARRMLGSLAEAEDMVQDAYVRWLRAPVKVESPTGFLVSATTNLCLDRLRVHKRQREHGAETWEPEATSDGQCESPESRRIRYEEISEAFVVVLERLGGDERTAFLLREVFDYDYPEVSRLLGKSEAACRQMVHRAHERVRLPQARFVLTDESRNRVVGKFLDAAATGCPQKVRALLLEAVASVGQSAN
jgi:RNA polymerase sigma factor (sigma-70 family)